MTTVGNFLDVIRPMVILHLGVEGMESRALRGAFEVPKTASRPSYVIAEAWDDGVCRKRGVEADAAGRIEQVMREYNEVQKFPSDRFERGCDTVDRERNLFFCKT